MSDMQKRIAIMGATAKCMEVIAPLDQETREQVCVALVLTILHDGSARSAVEDLVRKMESRVAR